MKIIHEKPKCIGCGACISLCSKHFKMDEEGKAHLINSTPDENDQVYEVKIEEADCAIDAAESCPVHCIEVKE